MFTRSKQYINSNKVSPEIFIRELDYSNSELLNKLDKYNNLKDYTITSYEHRIDLISSDIYRSELYSWILMYINRMTIDELKRGTIIKYIPLEDLTSIIRNLK